jgi:predicted ArsR family transcriptional regulator
MSGSDGRRWHAVATLVDRSRRSLYAYVRGQDHPVTRDEAAGATSMSHNLAAFHLDKLVAVGLLRARYEAPAGQRRGPGRTPKVYEATEHGIAVSIPDRRYALVGEILATAVAEAPANARAAALAGAHERGVELGRLVRGPGRPDGDLAGRDRGHDPLEPVVALLDELGFEPTVVSSEDPGSPRRLTVRNCPFHALAQCQPELVCSLNVAFVRGLLAGIGATRLVAELAPTPGHCCVEVRGGVSG